MKKNIKSSWARLLAPLLLLGLACTLSPDVAGSPFEPGYRYDELPTQANESAIIEEYRAISKWSSVDIAYYFVNGTEKLEGSSEHDLVRQAFGLWASQTALTFSEAATEGEADIVIGWASGDHGDGDPFDGPGDVLAHASSPNPYDDRQVFLHFDDDERWVNSDSRNVDLLTVAAHEIGHTLGLAHSNDPGALMYPSYDGPRRFLGEDDIAGIQDLYGLASDPAPAPDVPQNEAPPPSAGTDSDQDGIADQDELLVTGTNSNNPDSDADGLSDGVEVQNRMNPLDPDMDRDGIDDGQEVAQGSDPFFPEQADISPELEEDVGDFLTQAIELEIEAYRSGSADVAASVMTGDVLATLQSNIDDLNQQGLVMIAEVDYYQSYINDIRVIGNTQLEVDTCEVWTNTAYSLSDGQAVTSEGPALIPQTITIQQLDGSWYITDIQFFDAPAFCSL
jgi:hypothetical protein